MSKEALTKGHLIHDSQLMSIELSIEFTHTIAHELQPGDFMALYGEPGVGKTFFVEKICETLNAQEESFNLNSMIDRIVKRYITPDGLEIHHYDFSQLKDNSQLVEHGLKKRFNEESNIYLVEGAEKVEKFFPPKRHEVFFSFLDLSPKARRIQVFLVDVKTIP
jgi:tRNA A37 threonylcarbamoyladenosine biosynthesis protein TsaE